MCVERLDRWVKLIVKVAPHVARGGRWRILTLDRCASFCPGGLSWGWCAWWGWGQEEEGGKDGGEREEEARTGTGTGTGKGWQRYWKLLGSGLSCESSRSPLAVLNLWSPFYIHMESCLLMSTKELMGFKASRQDGCGQFMALWREPWKGECRLCDRLQ